MSNMNIDSRIQNFEKINNISEDEAKKRLEQEEIIEEQDTVEPYSQGQKLDKESFVVLRILLKIFKLKVQRMLFVIRATMRLSPNSV